MILLKNDQAEKWIVFIWIGFLRWYTRGGMLSGWCCFWREGRMISVDYLWYKIIGELEHYSVKGFFCILLWWRKGCCSRWLLVCFGARKSDPKLQLLCSDSDSPPSLGNLCSVFLIRSFFQFAIRGKILFGHISGSWWTLLLSRKYEPQ